jgi:peptidoglycan hydrolase-like protein with peptidoglycan-binding domain
MKLGARLSAIPLLVLAALSAGCTHTETVAETGEPSVVAADGGGNPGIAHDPANPLIVDSPDKLLLPGAGRRLQAELARRGYLIQPDEQALGEATLAALWRFQKENDLAATGFPDAETVRRLGFQLDEIYRPPPDPGAFAERLREAR